MPMVQTRRRFLTALSLAGAAGLVRAPNLLAAEGFTEIRYVDAPPGSLPLGKADFTLAYAASSLRQIDAGDPITLLSGVMIGCFELFARESIHGIPDLKGKTVGVQGLGSLGNTLVL